MPSDRDYILLLLGGAIYVILMHQIPALRNLSNTNTNPITKLEDIEGIDLAALNTVRQKGLM